jgi:hypothetical protein
MSTKNSADDLDIEERLDAIVERLDRIAEDLKKNTERTEISAKFVAEIHGSWKVDIESVEVPKLKTHIVVGDRVSSSTRVGTVQWFSIDSSGNAIATVLWDDKKTETSYANMLNRVATPEI